MTTPALRVWQLVKRFPGGRGRGPVVAVDGLSFDVEPGQLLTLLGPSGCGKTTALRCIAGLERPDAGEIAIGDRVLFDPSGQIDVAASRRHVGMVFQSYGIWPHMDVFEHVAFPLEALPRRRRLPAPEIRRRVERLLAVVQLDHVAHRRATDLSGGQQQRLVLARALVVEPPVLLLDEPLSNLDARLRDEMRLELKRLQRELGVTTVMVTHDQSEALGLSNVIAVMRAGRIEQVGSPEEVYGVPNSRFVAEFVGAANVFDGVVERSGGGEVLVKTVEGPLRTAVTAGATSGPAVGSHVQVVIRPERIGIDPVEPAPADPRRWTGVVETAAFLGESVDHVVVVGATRVRVRTDATRALPAGSHVALTLPAEACVVLPEVP